METTLQKEFEQYIRAAETCNAKREAEWHEKALDFLDKAENVLKQSGESNPVEWATVLSNQRYASYELGRVEDAMEICRRTIAELRDEWPYLAAYNDVRHCLRGAHHMLAWEIDEVADSLTEYLEGIQHNDACITHISPIEDESIVLEDLDGFYITRARLYLGAAQYDKSREPKAFDMLQRMIRDKKVAEGDDDYLDDVIESDDFIAHRENDPIEKLKTGKPGETWREAIARYDSWLELIGAERLSGPAHPSDVYNPYTKATAPDSAETIEKLEQMLEFPFPDSLKDLLTQHGAFALGGVEAGFHLDSAEKMLKGVSEYALGSQGVGIVSGVIAYWGERREFGKALTAEQIAFLNRSYKILGSYFCDYESNHFFCFDRNGKFASLYFHQDDAYDCISSDFEPLLEGNHQALSLDQLISAEVDRAIELHRRND